MELTRHPGNQKTASCFSARKLLNRSSVTFRVLVGACRNVRAVTHRGIRQSRDLYKCLGLRGKGLSPPPPKQHISQALGLKHLRLFIYLLSSEPNMTQNLRHLPTSLEPENTDREKKIIKELTSTCKTRNKGFPQTKTKPPTTTLMQNVFL